jgi:hypothetical protein
MDNNTPKAVYCSTLDKTFPSINSVVKTLGIRYLRVRSVLGGVAKSVNGYNFEWYDPDKHPTP